MRKLELASATESGRMGARQWGITRYRIEAVKSGARLDEVDDSCIFFCKSGRGIEW